MKNDEIREKTKPYSFSLISIICLLLFFQLVISVQADLIPPPKDVTPPFTIAVFILNLFINCIVFGSAYLLFIDRNTKNINMKKFFITLILITFFGFIADSIILHISPRHHGTTLFAIIFVSCLIFIFDFLIYHYYLILERKQSYILGLWMAIFTNPYIYIIFTTILPRY